MELIVAFSENYAIGRAGIMPWHLSADLKRVKSLTTGNVIIMGRKTLASMNYKPLPNRINIVLTRTPDTLSAPGCEIFSNLEAAIAFCRAQHPEKRIFIFGGAEIYKMAMLNPELTKMHITRIHTTIEDADTFFPEPGPEWRLLSAQHFLADEKNDFDYSFEEWVRN